MMAEIKVEKMEQGDENHDHSAEDHDMADASKANGTVAEEDTREKCKECSLGLPEEGLRAHIEELLRKACDGSLAEFDGIKKHWKNFATQLPGHIASVFCSCCKLHYQGFLRFTTHILEKIKDDTADAVESKAAHEAMLQDILTLVINFYEEDVSETSQLAILQKFFCPSCKPHMDLLQWNKDWEPKNKDDDHVDDHDHDAEVKEENHEESINIKTEADQDMDEEDKIKKEPEDVKEEDDKAVVKSDRRTRPELKSESGDPFFFCRVCEKPFRSLRFHIEDALWGISVSYFRGRQSVVSDNRALHFRAFLDKHFKEVAHYDYADGCAFCPACGQHFKMANGFLGGLMLHLTQHKEEADHESLVNAITEKVLKVATGGSCEGGEEETPTTLAHFLRDIYLCKEGGLDPKSGIEGELKAKLERHRPYSRGGKRPGRGGSDRGNKMPRVSGGPYRGGRGGRGGGRGGGMGPHPGPHPMGMGMSMGPGPMGMGMGGPNHMMMMGGPPGMRGGRGGRGRGRHY